MIKIAVVEDEIQVQQKMCSFVAKFCKHVAVEFLVDCFGDGNEFLTAYRNDYDVVFMDIQLGDTNGFETAKRLRQINGDVIIIFVTNLSQFALKGYEVSALDFLVKPVSYEVFALKMQRVVDKLKLEKDVVAINFAGGVMNLPLATVKYIETEGHAVVFHTVDGIYKTYASLKTIEKQISSPTFFKCNSCYLINLKYVRGINGFDLYIGDETLQISRARKSEFIEVLNKYLGGSL